MTIDLVGNAPPFFKGPNSNIHDRLTNSIQVGMVWYGVVCILYVYVDYKQYPYNLQTYK